MVVFIFFSRIYIVGEIEEGIGIEGVEIIKNGDHGDVSRP